jgi:magnesium transporter
MQVKWWKLDDKMGLVSVDPDLAVDAWRGKEASFWADVEAFEPGDLDAWLQEIGLSQSARECCLGAGEMSRIVPLKEAVFFEFPVHAGGSESEPTELGFLCLAGLVITLHQGAVSQLEYILERLQKGEYLTQETTSSLVAMLLLSFSSQGVQLAGALKKTVYGLDERMDKNPEDVDADEILECKSTLRVLDTVVDEHRATFDVLRMVHEPYLDLRSLTETFDLVSRNMSFADRTVDRLEKHLADLQQRYDTNQQEKTNKRLAVLTVISAIFLPLTLLAGIYGMNFDVMPELHFPYAYPIALGVMALVAVGLYRYFRANGWLD